jgi:hypothetical protein
MIIIYCVNPSWYSPQTLLSLHFDASKASLSSKQNVRNNIDHNTNTTHPCDDTKAQQILRLVPLGKEIGPIDLSKVTKCVDKSKSNTLGLLLHVCKSTASERQTKCVCSPKTTSHKDKEHVACGEVVDHADCDTADT